MRALLLTLILMPALASAQIYRWTDADGRVHFGQRPPAGAEQIECPQVVERDDQTREREARSERFFDARRREQQAAREQASQTRAAREQECQSLRSQLSQLQLGGRFFRNDAAGERVYYSDSELEAARQRGARRSATEPKGLDRRAKVEGWTT